MPMQIQELKWKCEMEMLIKANLATILVLLWENLISQQSIQHSKINLAKCFIETLGHYFKHNTITVEKSNSLRRPS